MSLALVASPSPEDLRSQVQGRSGHPAVPLAGVAASVDQAEVHQHDASARLTDDVVGLDVPVDEARAVDGGQGPAEVLADQRGLRGAEGAA